MWNVLSLSVRIEPDPDGELKMLYISKYGFTAPDHSEIRPIRSCFVDWCVKFSVTVSYIFRKKELLVCVSVSN